MCRVSLRAPVRGLNLGPDKNRGRNPQVTTCLLGSRTLEFFHLWNGNDDIFCRVATRIQSANAGQVAHRGSATEADVAGFDVRTKEMRAVVLDGKIEAQVTRRAPQTPAN